MNSNERKERMIQFSQQISLFIVLVGLFLGSMYAFNGNLFVAVPVSVVLVGLMYFFVQHMVGAKMEKKRSGLSIGNKALWVLYAVTSIPITILILHMFNVEMIEKDEIQSIGLKRVECLRNLKTEYAEKYEDYLTLKRSSLISDLNLYNSGAITQAELKTRQNVNDAFINGCFASDVSDCADQFINIDRMKFVRADTSIFGNTSEYLGRQEKIIRGWDRFQINQSISDLGLFIDETFEELNKYLNENAASRGLDPVGEEYKIESLIDQPIELLKKNLGVLLILMAFLVHGFLLLPYFIAPSRGYVSKGKSTSGKGGVTRR